MVEIPETALMKNLLTTVELVMESHNVSRVNRVYLSVGQLSNATTGGAGICF